MSAHTKDGPSLRELIATGIMDQKNRALEQMTLEELWQLFPIFLVPFNPEWKQWFEKEKHSLHELLPVIPSSNIHHIGSTAVEGMWAKNIVDILLQVPEKDLEAAAQTLKDSGYLVMSHTKDRISLNKGYTPEGFAREVFHIHLRIPGDHDELYFRDYLMEHPEKAKAYEVLKMTLWKKYPNNRDAYTKAKTGFISSCTKEALKEYAGRYEHGHCF